MIIQVVEEFAAGQIILLDSGACPSGWTRYAAADDRLLRTAATAGGTGGTSSHGHAAGPSHQHTIPAHSHVADHSHSFSGATGGPSATDIAEGGVSATMPNNTHTHSASGTSGTWSGSTDSSAGTETTDSAEPGIDTENDVWPEFTDMIICEKD